MKIKNNNPVQSPAVDDATAAEGIQSDRQVQDLTADLQRLQAEFINYKNRTEGEKAMLSEFAKVQVVKDLLPVIDDLERALAHLPEDLTDNKWAQGVKKIHSRLVQQLQKMGIQVIDALNKPFDPELHEAVVVEGDGDHQVVSEVIQNGYMLGSSVIRHSVVKVSNS